MYMTLDKHKLLPYIIRITYLEAFQVGNYQLQSLERIDDKVCLARKFSFLGTALSLVKAFTGALRRQW
jgi:hypothetical protein